MSIVVSTDVFCDGPGVDGRGKCNSWQEGDVGPRANARAARATARRKGWVRRGGKDLCPECAPKKEP